MYIPTYNFTQAKKARGYTSRRIYNYGALNVSPEDYLHKFYRRLPVSNIYTHSVFNGSYIKKKFPYRVNGHYKDILNRYNFFFKV